MSSPCQFQVHESSREYCSVACLLHDFRFKHICTALQKPKTVLPLSKRLVSNLLCLVDFGRVALGSQWV